MKYQVIVVDPPYNFRDKLSMSDVKRGAEANYSTMTLEEIKELPIKDISDPNGAILCLWVPSTLLQDGLDVMSAYGYTYKQMCVWVKTKKEPFKLIIKDIFKSIIAGIDLLPFPITTLKDKKDLASTVSKKLLNWNHNNILGFGLGHCFRNTHEICLIGINNTGIYKKLQNRSQRTVFLAENLGHSAKPENLQDSLDIMFGNDTLKVEIFSRRQRNGWITIGNECPGDTFGEDVRVSLSKLI